MQRMKEQQDKDVCRKGDKRNPAIAKQAPLNSRKQEPANRELNIEEA